MFKSEESKKLAPPPTLFSGDFRTSSYSLEFGLLDLVPNPYLEPLRIFGTSLSRHPKNNFKRSCGVTYIHSSTFGQ